MPDRPIVWGVDCAFRSVGVAVVELGTIDRDDRVLHVEALLTAASPKKRSVLVADDDARCVREIARWLQSLADYYPPTLLCAELPSGAKNAKAHHALGIAKGVLCTFATLRGDLPMAVCTPRELKMAATGTASASKEAVKRVLSEAYLGRLVEVIDGDKWVVFHANKNRWEHEADALGAYHACRHGDLVSVARRSVRAP